MSKAIPTEAMIEAAAKVLNERLAKHDGLFGVSRDMLSAALSEGQAQPVAWQCQDKHGQWITMPGDWSPSENVKGYEYRPLYLHPPVQVPVVKEGWRPIETAPLDGSDFLGSAVGRGQHIAYWAHWRDNITDTDEQGFRDTHEFGRLPWLTHWQPLPASPEQGEAE